MTIRTALFWVAAACCVVAELAILRSVLFGRASAGSAESVGDPRAKRSIEIAWAVLPALALIFILYLTWRAVDAPRPPAADVTTTGVTIGV